MKKLILILACLLGCASAQYMTVTASGCIGDGSGALLANGVLTIVGTDQNNHPIPYRAGSSSQSITIPITRGIVAGSLTSSLQLADPANTSPTNIRYHFTIQDNVTKKITDYPLILLVANDVLITGSFTQFNICKMNPLPNTTSIMTPTVSVANNSSEEIFGDFQVDGTTTHQNTIINQHANGDNALKLIRKTDSSPTGNYIQFRNAANSADVASISTLGQGNFQNITGIGLALTSKLSLYNNVSTIGDGIPYEVATIDLGSQTADIGFTSVYTVPTDGEYRVSAYIVVNRAATTSSTMPALWTTFQDADSLGTPAFLTSTSTANNTSTAATSVSFFNAHGGSQIVYRTLGYASVGATSMQYTIHIRVEKM